MRALIVSGLLCLSGCYGAVVEPGHRGLLFDPRHGGLQHEVLPPGYHHVGYWGRLDDFDVTFTRHTETIHTVAIDGPAYGLDVKVTVGYRPIISELYELDTEIGPNFYDEVIGPEFKSATKGVFAHHRYVELHANNRQIEDEVEAELRKRLVGKHIEIDSVNMEEVQLAQDMEASLRARAIGEQTAALQKQAQEAADEHEKRKIENDAIKDRMRAEAQLKEKENERKIAEEQAAIDRVKAATEAEVQVTKAKADAEETRLMASAHAEENKAERHTLTPLAVMDHAYEALGKLGGTGTMIMLGDWSKVPSFLFPHLPGLGLGQPAPAAQRSLGPAKTIDPSGELLPASASPAHPKRAARAPGI